MDFDVLEAANISQAELAFMCKTSRQTVNGWVTGKYAPRKSAATRLERVLNAIQLAVAAGELPVSPSEPHITVRKTLVVRPSAIAVVLKHGR